MCMVRVINICNSRQKFCIEIHDLMILQTIRNAGVTIFRNWQNFRIKLLLMTLVPVQKLCVNMYVYVYMYVHSLYEICYMSYIQRECH